MSCWLVPDVIVEFAGVTAIETNVGAFTVRVVLPVIPLEVALIVVLPVATVAARPAELMVATPVLEEVQVALLMEIGRAHV